MTWDVPDWERRGFEDLSRASIGKGLFARLLSADRILWAKSFALRWRPAVSIVIDGLLSSLSTKGHCLSALSRHEVPRPSPFPVGQDPLDPVAISLLE